VPASVEELAYFEAVRAIEEQSSVLASLQTRAGTLLAASSLVTVGVLWPRHRWRFVVSPARLIAAARAEPADDDVAKAHEEVALRLERMLDDNRTTLQSLFRTFRFSCVFLIAEVAAWISSSCEGGILRSWQSRPEPTSRRSLCRRRAGRTSASQKSAADLLRRPVEALSQADEETT
jgi:hypothetical protein